MSAQGAELGFTRDITHQCKQSGRATLLLEQAIATLHAEEPDELAAKRAQRLRGAAVLIHSAVLELAVTCGWYEAASSAEQHGLTEGNSTE